MKSNFKPLHFTIFAAAFITIISGLILILLLLVFYETLHPGTIIIFSVSIFTLTYLLIYLYLKNYLFRNVNDILKSISGFNRNPLEYRSINFNENVIETINKQVKDWIDINKKQVDKFNVLSDYRKQFLGDISHELKTPLFSVQGYLHTLLDGAINDENKNMEFLQKAIKNANRLEAIVTDLDMISKYEAGEINIEPVNFKIRKLFKEVFEELEYSASQKNITLSFKSDSNASLQANADPKQIRHVCINLVSNAIHYGKIGGYVKVGFYIKEDKINIEISDDGIGIPEKHLQRLFDRFYRIDTSRSRNKGGSGLGLSIVKHILTGHKQSIKVESIPGTGSTFRFTLDLAK